MENGISDPSDWLESSLPGFSALENSLRCQVCKDFYATPMMTSCSHTFCSICIRRCLSNDGKCPTCRTSDQASKLRINWSLEEVVSAFKTARPTALDIATKDKREQEDAPARPGKRRRIAQQDGAADEHTNTRKTRSSKRKMAQPEPIAVVDSDDEYTPEDGLVACPICNKRMKEGAVFGHIESGACEQEEEEEDTSSRHFPQMTPSSKPQVTAPKPADRLAELSYSLLNEKSLRKKLQELGIPSSGPKSILSRRHTEWVNLWNSNCDASNPRPKRELLDELRKWDRAQGEQARDLDTQAGGGVMKKEFDAEAWGKSNRDDFSRLIEEAKRKKAAAATTTATKPPTEESGTPNGEQRLDPARPYENNPQAMASIREKVDKANAGEHVEPPLNKDYEEPETQTRQPPVSTQGKPPKLVKDSSLPEHFNTGSVQKLPMFQVPSQPVADVDSAQASGGGR